MSLRDKFNDQRNATGGKARLTITVETVGAGVEEERIYNQIVRELTEALPAECPPQLEIHIESKYEKVTRFAVGEPF